MSCDITNPESIKPFITECLKRHKRHRDFKRMILQEGFSNDEYEQIKENDTAVIEKVTTHFANKIAKHLKDRDVKPFKVTVKERLDASSGKMRMIGREEPLHRLYDYIAVMTCENIWRRRLVPQQCSSIKGRGQVYGMRLIRKYILKDKRAADYVRKHKLRYTRKCKYFVKLDIRHCFQSIDRNLLLQLLSKDLAKEEHGEHLIYLWGILLKSYEYSGIEGIMIGSLPSQWAAQYLISFIYRKLSEQDGIFHIVIFMDDILITASNRRKLFKAVKTIRQYTTETLHLTIKPNFAIHKLEDTGIDMMGYVVHRNGKVTIRPKIFIHARRMVLRYRRNKSLSYTQAKRLISYKGYFLNSNCRKVWRDYNLKETFDYCENLISQIERKKKYGKLGTVKR